MLPIASLSLLRPSLLAPFAALALSGGHESIADHGHTTTPFRGVKVNGGTATHAVEGGKHTLTLSDDFKAPDAPDVHWQILDAKGNAFLLNRLAIKGEKANRSIVLPAEVREVAKVQFHCAWAEVVLGEASFAAPLATEASMDKASPTTATLPATSKPFAGSKANKGTVTAKRDREGLVLALSEDFVVPDTPDVHWQVLDSKGHAHLLQRVKTKGMAKDDKVNRSIAVPPNVPDVAKVQMWCAFAETNLGEAAFETAVR